MSNNSSSKNDKRLNFIKKLVQSRNAMLKITSIVICCLLITIWFAVMCPSFREVWSTIFLAVITSIIASLLVYFYIQSGTEKIYSDIIHNKIKDDIIESRFEVVKDIKDIFNSYGDLSPSMTYAATNNRNTDLLEEYEKLLDGTTKIDYKGDKLLFLATKLSERKKNPDTDKCTVNNLRIIIPDITNFDMIKLRAERYKKYNTLFQTNEAKGIALTIDIIKSIYAFKDLRENNSQFKFLIRMYNGIDTFRTEIFDDAVLVSVLTLEDKAEYPPALLYKKSRLSLYHAFKGDFEMTWECCQFLAKKEGSDCGKICGMQDKCNNICEISSLKINDDTIDGIIIRSKVDNNIKDLQKECISDWNALEEHLKVPGHEELCVDRERIKLLWKKRTEEK